MKVLILNIATNKYTRFLDNFYASCDKFFLPDLELNYLLFTDNMKFENSLGLPIKKSYVEHKPFPEPTLKRFHYFLQERDYIETFDYVFYSDVDMQFVKPVSQDEVCSDLTLTVHPLIKTKQQFTFEKNPKSTAFISPEEEGEHYFCGGFNGGSSKKFMKMADQLANNIDIDIENNIIATWHDESHINRYAINNPPTKIVDWCVTDWYWAHTGVGKLACLTKNHEEVRL